MNKEQIQEQINKNLKLIEQGGLEVNKLKQKNKELIKEFIKLDDMEDDKDVIKYPRIGEVGYVIINGEVGKVNWEDCYREYYYMYNNWFETKEEAEIELMYRELYFKLKNYAKRKGYLIDRKDVGDWKVTLYCDFYNATLQIGGWKTSQCEGEFKDLYFKTEKYAEQVALTFKEEILEYLNKKYNIEFIIEN